MKSQKAKEFIDGCMAHLTVEMSDHAKWQLRTAMTHAAELAEQDAKDRVRKELTRWHDPKEELPEDDREVLCIVNRQHSKYAVLRHDNYGWWQYVPFQGGGWCGYDGEVCGWREIHE